MFCGFSAKVTLDSMVDLHHLCWRKGGLHNVLPCIILKSYLLLVHTKHGLPVLLYRTAAPKKKKNLPGTYFEYVSYPFLPESSC